jgi:hypothetical protein
MPKSRIRRKFKKGASGQVNWGGRAAKSSRRIDLVFAAIALVALIAGGIYYWQDHLLGGDFEALAAQGQAALGRVKTTSGRGGHLGPGQTQVYVERFPTSGKHDPVPIDPGFYRDAQPATKLVHSVEHGHIVIYYENPGVEAVQFLKDWSSLYGADWQGVIATPASGLRQVVMLTAWRKSLRLAEFDPAAAAAFIDKYRGRGPENPVR